MKSVTQTFFVITMTICSIALIAIACRSNTFNAKEYAEENHCPYEGFECPNAQQALFEDSLAYASAEYAIDSLIGRTIQLETQLAGCEHQDHSKLVKH